EGRCPVGVRAPADTQARPGARSPGELPVDGGNVCSQTIESRWKLLHPFTAHLTGRDHAEKVHCKGLARGDPGSDGLSTVHLALKIGATAHCSWRRNRETERYTHHLWVADLPRSFILLSI